MKDINKINMKNIYLIFDRHTESNELNRLLHFLKKNNDVCNNKISCTVTKRTLHFKITCKIIKSGLELSGTYFDTMTTLNVNLVFNDEFDKLKLKGKVDESDVCMEYVDREFSKDSEVFLIVLQNIIKKKFHIAHVVRNEESVNVYKYTSDNSHALLSTFNDRFDRWIVAKSESEIDNKINDKLLSIKGYIKKNNRELKNKISKNNECVKNIDSLLSEL